MAAFREGILQEPQNGLSIIFQEIVDFFKNCSVTEQNDPVGTFLVRSVAQAVNFLLKLVIPSTSASRLNLIYVECYNDCTLHIDYQVRTFQT